MAKGTISVNFKITEGKDGLKELTMDAKALQKMLEANARAAKAFSSKFVDSAAFTTTVRGISDAVSQLNGTLSSLTSESLNFSKSMKAANTMAGKSGEDYEKLKDDVAELAKTVPVARDALANGLYQVISNGVPEENWISFLEKSARSSVGGIADLGQVVGVTSTIIKNYGLEWDATSDIQDKIQLTAKNGVTSFEQLAAALPRVTGNAATLGVSIDELMGAFATLTGVSGNTAEVSTQLAAIFTALVKPSSEATKMASEMGIQFDAAAIKAAGGFENFLHSLDESVKAYSAASGVLEQEVYGKLFGSAESLRALVPLQGELAAKFSENVANMVESAGTMDRAYESMSSTGEATTQMLKNQFAVVTDWIASFTSSIQPYINFTAQLGTSIVSIAILCKTIKSLNIQQWLLALRSKAAAIAMTALGAKGHSTAAVMRVLSSGMHGGVYAAMALKIALRGLLISTGVGIAIWGLTEIVNYFVSSADKAKESVDELSGSTNALTQAENTARAEMVEVRAQLTKDIATLKTFKGTKEQERALVEQLNQRYGESLGYYSSVSDWYKELTENSKTYCRQMINEARSRAIANKIAELEQDNFDLTYNEDGSLRDDADLYKNLPENFRNTKAVQNAVKIGNASRNAMVEHNNKIIKTLIDEMEGLMKETPKPKPAPKVVPRPSANTSAVPAPAPSTDPPKDERTELQKIEDQIRSNQDAVLTASLSERATLKESTLALVKKRDELRKLQDELVKMPAPEYVPQTIDRLNTLDSLEEAIQHYREKQGTATADEIQNIQMTIDALESKRAAMSRGIEIPSLLREAKEIDALTTKDHKIKIRTIGIEGLTEKIKELNGLLADTENPMTEAQRKNVEDLISTYERWRRESVDTFSEIRNGYGSLKEIGASVTGITDALEGNGNAWEKTTAILDGFLQLYEGIRKIIETMTTLTGLSKSTAASKQEETQALAASTTALGAEAGAAASNAASQMMVAEANKAVVASIMEKVAAAYYEYYSGQIPPDTSTPVALATEANTFIKSIGLTRFAKGGIISGPTLGLMGEYPGASNNPEVVAPLDKLRTMLKPVSGTVVTGRFTVSGRELVAVLENETRIASTSGRRFGLNK